MATYFIGIGGSGMSSLAFFLLQQGERVMGSDQRHSVITEQLEAAGARVYYSHNQGQIEGAQRVIYSSAIPANHPELRAARDKGLPLLHRAQLLSGIVNQHHQSIAVCGTHGKGTTAGALIAMIQAAGRSCSYILGAPLRQQECASAYTPEADFLVAEVDESDRSHLQYRPTHLLINNLEVDHLNTYSGLDDIVASFAELVAAYQQDRPDQGQLIIGLDSAGTQALTQQIKAPFRSWSAHGPADLRSSAIEAAADGSMRLQLHLKERPWAELTTALRGHLNAFNLLSAAALAQALDLGPQAVIDAAAQYSGLTDRYHEHLANNIRVVTDYASHPTSISANLQDLAARTPGKVIAVFQPFRYSLFGHHFDGYLKALAPAQLCLLAPLDPCGEKKAKRAKGLSSERLAKQLEESGTPCLALPDIEDIENLLYNSLDPLDSLIVFGGGPLFEMAHRIIHWLQEEAQIQ